MHPKKNIVKKIHDTVATFDIDFHKLVFVDQANCPRCNCEDKHDHHTHGDHHTGEHKYGDHANHHHH